MIDKNARGNIADKFLKTRVQLPLYAALRKKITLTDEITVDKVKVQVYYERLPNFCMFCGFIGHMEASCDFPTADRKIKYSLDMRVQPVHFADPRTWILPEAMGTTQAQQMPAAPWRASKPAPAIIHQGAIEQVADEVAKLKFVDTNTLPSGVLENKKDDAMPI
uniref:Uncharacterized protein n=1 Tax=Avena sativa TaxID=4498 RepID=A0ACD5U5U0_AVESA